MIPSCNSVRSCLASFQGARAYHPEFKHEDGRFVGNNGDHLIRIACSALLKEYQIEEVQDPNGADFVVIDGGAIREDYRVKPLFIAAVFSSCSSLPVVLMPSSVLFRPGTFGRLFGGHPGPIRIFCRDIYSFSQLTGDVTLGEVTLEMDHDLAFEIRTVPLYAPLVGRVRTHILIVERRDFEHPDGRINAHPRLDRVAGVLPAPIKQWMYPLYERAASARRTPYRLLCESVASSNAAIPHLPTLARDISNPRAYSLETYCACIAAAGAVFTTRLHVAILSSLLGIPTYLADGPYHKMRGVYEYSLAGFPDVVLMRQGATDARP